MADETQSLCEIIIKIAQTPCVTLKSANSILGVAPVVLPCLFRVVACILFNIPIIRVVIFVVFDFNTNFTFYNQINWSRCRRITPVHPEKGIQGHPGLKPTNKFRPESFDRGCIWKDGRMKGSWVTYCHCLHLTVRRLCTWGPRSVANLCKYLLSPRLKAVQLVPRYLLFCWLHFEYSILPESRVQNAQFHACRLEPLN